MAELLGEQAVEQLSRTPHERLSGEVLVVPRRLADEHQIRSRVPRREDHLGPAAGERAGDAAERLRLELGEGRHWLTIVASPSPAGLGCTGLD